MTTPIPPAGAVASSSGASYWTLTVDVPAASEEIWSLFCYDQGALGAETLQDEGEVRVLRFFFDRPVQDAPERWPADFAAAHPGLPGPLRIVAREEPVQPWATAWQAHFEPLPVGERLAICPPWQATGGPGCEGRLPVVIDPGQGFGTGRHPSTALALSMLERHLAALAAPPDRMADVGAGSGILGLAARRLGVGAVWAADIDPIVLPEISHNFALNGFEPPAGLTHGGPGDVPGTFPLVVANIVTGVLIAHATELARLTVPGGSLILSGILQTEASELLAHYAGLGLVSVDEGRREQWFACRLQPVAPTQGGPDGNR